MIAQMIRAVLAGARTQPLVLVFEDLHWADPTTLEALRGIAERGALAPLFVVATTRPEFRPPWGDVESRGRKDLRLRPGNAIGSPRAAPH